jgi:putative ABC transport system ATP-binding protein
MNASPRSEHGLAIDVRNVRKVYGSGATSYEALRGVDFQVAPGEFVMLSGPSGSGKTTLLSILGCVLSATSGQVKLLGDDISRAPEGSLADMRLSLIGFVFQMHNLIASLSAIENVTMLLEMRGMRAKLAKAEAERMLVVVGLGDKLRSLPRDLSGGQRQRVSIARALAGAPPLILADEPTAALDAQNGLAITELLRSLAKDSGHTVVVVTHDNRIFHLADRMVRIEDGLIQKEPS